MNKVQRIRHFIEFNRPTRGEIIKFIVVHLNKRCSSEEFKLSDYKGYYGNAFTPWKYYGFIKVTPKTKKYRVTTLGWERDNWYKEPPEQEVKRLRIQNSNLRNHLSDLLIHFRMIKILINENI